MAKNILITGASGLVGSRLTELLLEKGYQVSHLGRNKKPGRVPSFVWDVGKKQIDSQSIVNVDTIVHLAGAGVADKRWTKKRKKEIVDSRTHSTALLFQALANNKNSVSSVISASAIGYYGFYDESNFLSEESQPGTDFLATVTRAWEEAVDQFISLGLRVVKLRIGIVLSEKGGALKSMTLPVRYGVGSPLGSGQQHVSWIHVDDLCLMFIKAIEDDSIHGAYNAVGPNPVTNKELTQAIGKFLKKLLWVPPIPTFLLKIILGEMANMVVHGSKISSNKIQQAGFKFKYADIQNALSDLFKAAK